MAWKEFTGELDEVKFVPFEGKLDKRKPEDVGFFESAAQAGKRGLASFGDVAEGYGVAKEKTFGTEQEVAKRMAEAKAAKQQAAEEETGLSFADLQRIYKDQGLPSALAQAPKYITEQVLQSAPQMAVPLLAGEAATALTAPVLGPAAPIAGLVAGVGTYGAQQFGNFMKRQAEEAQRPEDISVGRAAGAAAVTAPIGFFADKLTAGLGSLGEKGIVEVGKELARRKAAGEIGTLGVAAGVAKQAGKGATVGIIAEAPTEVLEAVGERWQAGLSLTNEDARNEYLENFMGAAAAGAGIGAPGRARQAYSAYAEAQGVPPAGQVPPAPPQAPPPGLTPPAPPSSGAAQQPPVGQPPGAPQGVPPQANTQVPPAPPQGVPPGVVRQEVVKVDGQDVLVNIYADGTVEPAEDVSQDRQQMLDELGEPGATAPPSTPPVSGEAAPTAPPGAPTVAPTDETIVPPTGEAIPPEATNVQPPIPPAPTDRVSPEVPGERPPEPPPGGVETLETPPVGSTVPTPPEIGGGEEEQPPSLTVPPVVPQGEQIETVKDLQIPNENGAIQKYTGQVKNGKPNGKGQLSDSFGTVFTGDWVDGKLNGQGKETGPRLGYPKSSAEPTHRYAGGFKDGEYHGNGTLIFNMNRSKYVGEFKNGRYDGQGSLSYTKNNGYEAGESFNYVGQFRNGDFSKGTFTRSNGEVYTGEFKGMSFDGQGELTFPDGSKYVGGFKDGKFDGQGTSISPDGTKVEGEWKDGKPAKQEEAEVVNNKTPSPNLPADKRLVLMPCSSMKGPGRAKASDLYKGVFFQTFNGNVKEGGKPNVVILSAKHGFLSPDDEIDPYDEKLDKAKTEDFVQNLNRIISDKIDLSGIEDVLIVGGKDYQRVMKAYVQKLINDGVVSKDASINATSGEIGEQRSQLGKYLQSINVPAKPPVPPETAPPPVEPVQPPAETVQPPAQQKTIPEQSIQEQLNRFQSGDYSVPKGISGTGPEGRKIAEKHNEQIDAVYDAAVKRFLEGDLTAKVPTKKQPGISLEKQTDLSPKPVPKGVQSKPPMTTQSQKDAMIKVAADGDIRYYLNGVHIDEARKAMVSTDGHRLAVLKDPVLTELPPNRPAGHTVIGPKNEWIDGKFPDWEKVVPKSHGDKMTIEAAPLGDYARGVKKASRYAGEKLIAMSVDINGKNVLLNPEYVADMTDLFRRFGYNTFEVSYTSTAPGKQELLMATSADGKLTQVIMPVREKDTPFKTYVFKEVKAEKPPVKEAVKPKETVKPPEKPTEKTAVKPEEKSQAEFAQKVGATIEEIPVKFKLPNGATFELPGGPTVKIIKGVKSKKLEEYVSNNKDVFVFKQLARSKNPIIKAIGELADRQSISINFSFFKDAGKNGKRWTKEGYSGMCETNRMTGESRIYFRDPDFASDEHTVAHEIAHALTNYAILNPTNKQKPYIKNLEDLFTYVKNNMGPNHAKKYAFTNLYEFVAEGNSNAQFQYELSQIPYKNKTAWGAFTSTISKLLGFKEENALTELLSITAELAGFSSTLNPMASTDDEYLYTGVHTNYQGGPIPLSQWSMAGESKLDNFLYKLQDKNIDLKRVTQEITHSLGQIADRFNPYMLEELYHGRTAQAIKMFLNKDLRPILKTLMANKISLQDFETFLHARHAEERNDYINNVNRTVGPNGTLVTNPVVQDKGSGMETRFARNYLASIPPDKRRVLNALGNDINKIIKDTQRILVDGGIEKQSTIDAWNRVYNNYVPLMRDPDELDFVHNGSGMGQGFSVKGGFSKNAYGSTKTVVDIFSNIALQREKAINKAERARVGRAVYGLAITAPNPDFWLPVNPAAIKSRAKLVAEFQRLGIPASEIDNLIQEPKVPVYDKNNRIVRYQVNPAYRSSDNVLAVRVNGEDRFVFFNPKDPRALRMARSMKNLDPEQLGVALGAVADMTRWIASVNTQFNPVFGAWNFARDVQSAAINLSSTPLANDKAEVLSNVWPALATIYKDLRGTRQNVPAATTAMNSYWERFEKAGGKTGYREQFSKTARNANIIEKEMADLNKGNFKKTADAVFNWLSDYNDAMENAVRVAAFKVAVEKGMSDEKAASLAKNLTVNFNRRGQLSPIAGALYAFFNASVQGTARLANTLFVINDPTDLRSVRLSPAGKKIVAGGMALGVFQALALAMAGYDDDEPPEFLKDKNIIIPTGGGNYLIIPMPLGFNVLPGLGRIATEYVLGQAGLITGAKGAGDKLSQAFGLIVDSFNPLGSSGFAQTLAPTIADPFVAVETNKDAFGRPIHREDRATSPTPGYLRTRENATVLGKGLAEFLNYVSGGTKYQKGAWSPTGDDIDYLVGQFTGGVGREIIKAGEAIKSVATGEELPSYRVPIAGKLYGETETNSAISDKFYKNVTRLSKFEDEIKGRAKNREDVQGFLKEHPDARLWSAANNLENSISKLNKSRRELMERPSTPELEAAIKRMDESKYRMMKNFNEQVKNLERQ